MLVQQTAHASSLASYLKNSASLGLAAACVLAIAASSPASAQSQAGYEAFIRQCVAAGGTHQPGPGYGTCVPRRTPSPPPTSPGVSPSSPPAPAGPSPSELRRQREAQDLQEAADDAQDRGYAAYQHGDYTEAERWFAEAADYAPDDPDIAQNLSRTRERLGEIEAQRELESARGHGAAAVSSFSAENSREQAGRVFDQTGAAQRRANTGASAVPVVAGAAAPRDPVVPAARRTPAITEMERQRAAHRTRIAALEAELETLTPSMHGVRIVRRRQEIGHAEAEVNILNFSIDEALRAPPAATPTQAPQAPRN